MNPRPPALLVVNPAAHSVSPGQEDPVMGALSRGFDVELAETKSPGHATELASEAAEQGLGLVVVLGGDGTVNEVANGLAGTGTALSVLPGGEANILARSLGIGRDPVQAARALATRAGDEPRLIPLARLNARWFVSNCGVGLDAAIVRRVERNPKAKQRGGDLFFLWSGVRVFFSEYDRKAPHLDLSWGPSLEHRAEGVFLVIVQNLPPYTYFGRRPMRMCPDASLESGLDVLAMDSFRPRHVLPVAVSTFTRARHPRRKHVVYVRDQRRLHVHCRKPMPVQADGEYLGEHEEIEIEGVPGGLRVL